MHASVQQCALQIVAVAALLLAGKVEETPHKLQQVLHAAVEARFRRQPQLAQQVMVRLACCRAALGLLMSESCITNPPHCLQSYVLKVG